MIEPDDTILFEPGDVPELEEMQVPQKRNCRQHEVPEPTDWRPIGVEW